LSIPSNAFVGKKNRGCYISLHATHSLFFSVNMKLISLEYIDIHISTLNLIGEKAEDALPQTPPSPSAP
jgi:hypothetical protein